jgi:hypothetical protein
MFIQWLAGIFYDDLDRVRRSGYEGAAGRAGHLRKKSSGHF